MQIIENATDKTPIGGVIMMGAKAPNDDYIRCTGQAINQATYPVLYALVGSLTPVLGTAFPRVSLDPVKVDGFTVHDWSTGAPAAGITCGADGGHSHKVGNKVDQFDHGDDDHRGSYDTTVPADSPTSMDGEHTHTLEGGDSQTLPQFVRTSFWIRGK